MPRKDTTPTGLSIEDIFYLGILIFFSIKLTGPVSVIVLAGAMIQMSRRFRASYFPVYLVGIGTGIQAFRIDGFVNTNDYNNYSELAIVILRCTIILSILVTLLMDRWLCPLGGRIPKVKIFRTATAPRSSTTSNGNTKPVDTSATEPVVYDTAMQEVKLFDGGALLRIYYPATVVNKKKGELVPYFLHGVQVLEGTAHFLKVPAILLKWLIHTKAWCYEADPEDAYPANTHTPYGYKIILFSHGLGGTPDVYGNIIQHLVAAGYLVAALHHADGSSSFIQMDSQYSLTYEPLTSAERSNPSKEHKRRHLQLTQRAREVQVAIDLLQDINTRPYQENDEAKVAPDLALARLLLYRRMNMNSIIAMGHSFGAATALMATQSDSRIKACVLHDPWMFPLSAITLCRGITDVPIFTITGEGYRKWKANNLAVNILTNTIERSKYVNKDKDNTKSTKDRSSKDDRDGDSLDISGSNGITLEGKIMTPEFYVLNGETHPGNTILSLKGIEHANFSDFAVLAERMMRFRGMLGKKPARIAQEHIIQTTLEWLKHIEPLLLTQDKDKKGATDVWKFTPSQDIQKELFYYTD